MTIHQPRILLTYYLNQRDNKAERSLSKPAGLHPDWPCRQADKARRPSTWRSGPDAIDRVVRANTPQHSARSRLFGALDARNPLSPTALEHQLAGSAAARWDATPVDHIYRSHIYSRQARCSLDHGTKMPAI